MNYPELVRSCLFHEIAEMSENPRSYVKNPDTDFTRTRKLPFGDLIRFLITMGSGTTGHELLKFFDYAPNTVSNSAFCQQRNKLLTNALPNLLHRFNVHFPLQVYRGKYNLVACDGSEFQIARNPDDPSTFYPPGGQSLKGFNMLHTVYLYDILSKRYLDCVIQPGRHKNEFRAICDLTDRYSYEGIPIFIGDRGFSCYNFYAHAMENGSFFLVRAKDVIIRRFLGLDALPDFIDTRADLILTRNQSKKYRKHPDRAEQYRYINYNVAFDYVEPGSFDEYLLSLRIIRIGIMEGVFENLITNLPEDEFSVEDLKEFYHLRWDIETSFRDLKHTLGADGLHSKKIEYITQEIWARLILFNFCAVITANVSISQHDTKHLYQINFSMAMKICHHFIRFRGHDPPWELDVLIGSNTLPIRHGRTYARRHRPRLPASFGYRPS